jgi:hypothetical protein
MTDSRWVLALAAGCWLLSASPGMAQFWPGSPYAYYGGAWGGYPAGQYNTTREIAAQSRQVGQAAAIGQNLVVQSGIRNTLLTQAQQQTNAIQSQQQANQDWWFQVQQQQMAEQRARGPSAPAPVGGGYAADPAAVGYGLPVARPPVAADIIQWPPVLQEPTFAALRAEIEAPYRRSPPAVSAPTADDYRNMVKTVQEMKAVLEWRLGQGSGLLTQDYDQAKAFLDKMGQEALARSGVGNKSPS